MSEPLDEAADAAGTAGAAQQLDLIRSYAAFASRAIRLRKFWVASVLIVGVALTAATYKLLPRTYSCTTVLMALSNPILDQYGGGSPLANAPTLITRQENREALVRETNLVEAFKQRRPPLLRFKDDLIQKLFGQWSLETQEAILVGTLQSKLSVGSDNAGNLTITVDWSDGTTAAEIAAAARDGFIRGRHSAEISAFEAKMSILDEHATKLRSEVETLAQQINSAHEERSAEVTKKVGAATAATPATAAVAPTAVAPTAVRTAARRVTNQDLSASLSAELPERKAKLAELKQQLAQLESERERRIRDEQAKLAEMLLHLTPNHPQVVTERERIALASQVPSELAMLRGQVADLEGTIKQREALATRGSATIFLGGSGVSAGAGPSALPQEIIQALENDTTDPALSAQISGAVVRYGSLRDDIRGARMQLDTAQAAFDHRYQIVVPAEVPNTPIKPKPGLVLGAGLALSLLIALLLPILAELRRDVIVERWQVSQMQLPVLAELKLPPHSSE